MGLRGHLPDVKLHPRDPGGMGRGETQASSGLCPGCRRFFMSKLGE